MISISEKDGATIIVIENPTGSEQRVIEQARKASKVLSDDVWSKFACNKNKYPEKSKVEKNLCDVLGETINLDDFEPICDTDDCPF